MNFEFLTKEQKDKLKEKGIFYYNSFLFFIFKIIATILFIKFSARKISEAAKEILSSNINELSILLKILPELFIYSSVFILFMALFFILLSSKFYFKGFKFGISFFPNRAPINSIFFKSLFSILFSILAVVSFLLITLVINANIRVYTDINLAQRILVWFNSNYWQMLIFCCILGLLQFVFSYVGFQFKNKKV